MIDMIYNLRVGDIHAAQFSDEFNKLCIPFEESLSEEQIEVFHKNTGLRERYCRRWDESCIQGRFQGRSGFNERNYEVIMIK